MALSLRGPSRGDYGQRWGEGAARCFSMESDPFDEDESVRLMPIPECFICPMSQTPMEDPVMTVDGCVYERSYIEQWIRHRQQQRLKVTSPATNQELPSHRLVSLTALQKAIEAYIGHRPELRESLTTSRSFEEAAQMLQSDLLEKQAMHVGTEDELSLLRDSNEVLIGALQEAERSCGSIRKELDCTKGRNRLLEEAVEQEQAARDALDDRVRALELQCQEASGALGEYQQALAEAKEAAREAEERLTQKAAAGAPWARGGEEKLPRRCTLAGVLVFLICFLSLFIAYFIVRDQGKPAERGQPCVVGVLDPVANASLREDWALDWAKRKGEPKAGGMVGSEVMDFSLKNKAAGAPAEGERDGERRHQLAAGGHMESRPKDAMPDVDVEHEILQLRVGSQDEKTNAALVLSILATASQENQAAIVRAGAVGPLVELLRGDMPEARGQAAVALRALATDNSYNKVAIVRAGAAHALIRLLKEDTEEVQEVAAAALQTLAETSNQVEIAQAGAIVPLVALLKDERSGVREEAAGALVILALNADNQVAIAQVGAVPLLVDLLRDRTAEVREQAAAALRNLAAENKDNQVAISRAGAFAPLAELLQDPMPRVREEALAALKNLAGDIGLHDDATREAAQAAGVAIKEAATAATAAPAPPAPPARRSAA